MAKFTLIIFVAIFTVSKCLNTKIFAKTLKDLSPDTENYHQFVETVFEKRINNTCWFIARNGSCAPNLVTRTTKRVHREASSTAKPINLAKNAILAGLKLLAPMQQRSNNSLWAQLLQTQ